MAAELSGDGAGGDGDASLAAREPIFFCSHGSPAARAARATSVFPSQLVFFPTTPSLAIPTAASLAKCRRHSHLRPT